MSSGPDLRTLRTLATMSLAAYVVAILAIVIGWIAGGNRVIIGSGFLVGGLATLASLVVRLIVLAPARPPAAPGQRPASRAPRANLSGLVIRAAASLVMLWVGTSLLIRH